MSMLQPSGQMLAAMAARGRPAVPTSYASAPGATPYPTYTGPAYHQATYGPPGEAGTRPRAPFPTQAHSFHWLCACSAPCIPGGLGGPGLGRGG